MALVTKNFSDIITFTRASTATYFNSAGVLTSAATNAPRLDYDPSTLAAQGLLIEESRANICLYSEEFDIWNINSGTTVTANATASPAGTTTADKIVETAANVVHYRGRSNVLAANTTCTLSVYVKASERNFVGLQLTPDGTNYIYCTFNVQTGVASTPVNAGNGSGATASIQAINNGWYRCVLTGIPSSTAANPISAIYVGNANVNLITNPYLGDGTSGIFAWGAQLEAGAFSTSYIPTTTTALTRAADVASVNMLSPWFNATEGTLYGEFAVPPNLANFPSTMAFSDGTTSNQIASYAVTSGLYTTIRNGGVSQGDPGVVGSPVVGTNAKYAIAIQTNNCIAAWNGAIGVVDASVTLPTVDRFRLGVNGAGNGIINGYLRRITYYPRRLSNAELQAITA